MYHLLHHVLLQMNTEMEEQPKEVATIVLDLGRYGSNFQVALNNSPFFLVGKLKPSQLWTSFEMYASPTVPEESNSNNS